MSIRNYINIVEQELTEIQRIPASDMNERSIRERIVEATSYPRKKFGMLDDVRVSYREDGDHTWFVFGKDRVALGFALLEKYSFPGHHGYFVMEIGLLPELRYQNIGYSFYMMLLDRGYTLFSGGMQTADSVKVWKKLMKDPALEYEIINIYRQEDGFLDRSIDPWSRKAYHIMVKKA